MAIVVIGVGRVIQVSKWALTKAVRSLGLSCEVMKNCFGVNVAVVFQPRARLADFYDAMKVIETYQDVGVELTPQVYETPLKHFITQLATESFPRSIRYRPLPRLPHSKDTATDNLPWPDNVSTTQQHTRAGATQLLLPPCLRQIHRPPGMEPAVLPSKG